MILGKHSQRENQCKHTSCQYTEVIGHLSHIDRQFFICLVQFICAFDLVQDVYILSTAHQTNKYYHYEQNVDILAEESGRIEEEKYEKSQLA